MSGAPAVAAAKQRTPRLVLQPLVPADREALHALLTHPDVRRYLMDDVIVPIADVDVIVATSGLTRFADGTTPELLYTLHPDFQGRGLAVEATRALLAHVFATSDVREVFARADVSNRASIRVMERLGMRFLRQEVENGLPLVTFGMTRAVFQERGQAGSSRRSASGLTVPRSG